MPRKKMTSKEADRKYANGRDCKYCGEWKCSDEFYPSPRYKNGLSSECKKCSHERYKDYYSKNKERINKTNRDRYYKNIDKEKERKRKYSKRRSELFKKRYAKDSSFRLDKNIRQLIYKSFKPNGFKKSKKTEEILGISIDEFKEYIAGMFKYGMTLDNHGEWHLDHIIPSSSAKTEEELIKLNHYTNFQPLFAKDNISKGNKY